VSEAAAVPLVPICAVGGGATIATPTTVTLPFLEHPIATNHIPEGLKCGDCNDHRHKKASTTGSKKKYDFAVKKLKKKDKTDAGGPSTRLTPST